jgi:hypothetical protein
MEKQARGRAVPPAIKPRSKKKKGKNARSAKDPRWFFGIEKASLGPFSVEGLGVGSGEKRSNRSMAPSGITRSNMSVTGAQTSAVHTRRELVGVVNGNTTFGVTEYRINPGNAGLFPWLSNIAENYEKYLIRRMHVQFVQTGSGFAAANVSGRLVLGCDYDVMSPPVASDAEAENKDPNVPVTPFENAELILDAQLLNPDPKFVRGVNYPPGSDPKTYDGGKIFVAVSGTPNANQIGLLYIVYDVLLITPQQPQVASFIPNYHIAGMDPTAGVVYPTGANTPLTMVRSITDATGSLTFTVGGGPAYSFSLAPGIWVIHGYLIVSNNTNQLQSLRVQLWKNGALFRDISRNSFGAATSTALTANINACVGSTLATDSWQIIVIPTSAGGTNQMEGPSFLWFEF